MVKTPEKIEGIAVVNGAELYYEKQGAGIAVLLISGSTGDAGNFTPSRPHAGRRIYCRHVRPAWQLAESSPSWLDDDFRGRTSGRRRGTHWLTWPLPGVVFGASAGGLIALDLMIRHPEVVRAGIVQEPSIFSVLPDPIAALAPRRALIEEALRTKGPRAAIEGLMRYLNDDAVLAAIPSETLERMLGNADTIFTIEGPGFSSWKPKTEDLTNFNVPITLMFANETLPVYKEVTHLLAKQLNAEIVIVPGRHGFYFYRPQDLADAVRRVVKRCCSAEIALNTYSADSASGCHTIACSQGQQARLPVWVNRVILVATDDFRSSPVNGHRQGRSPCPNSATSGLMHCSKRRCYSIISAARIADRPSSLGIGSHSFSCLKFAFLIPIQGRPSQSFIYDRRCGRINYQSGGPAPSSIFRQLSYGKLFEDFFAFSLE